MHDAVRRSRPSWAFRTLVLACALSLAGCTLILRIFGSAFADVKYLEYTISGSRYFAPPPVKSTSVERRASIKAVTAPTLDAFTPTAAFRGNQVAVVGSALGTTPLTGSIFVRESSCSLTQYGINNGSPGAITATLPAADAYLHRLSGLTTTAGTFPKGCADRVKGVPSAPGVYLGQLSGGDLLSAFATPSGKITVLRVTTLGAVVSQTDLAPDGAAALTLATADLNGDGIADLVTPFITSGGASGIGVFLGRSDGSFAPLTIYTAYASDASRLRASVSLEDLDGDGRIDIVGLAGRFDGTTNPTVVALLGTGSGSFVVGSSRVVPIDTGPFVLADFNGDRRIDLLTSGGSFVPGNGDGSFGTPVQALTGFNSGFSSNLAVGDVNGDGKLDVVRRTGTFLTVYLGAGDGTFVAGANYATITGADYLNTTDIDGDGNADIVVGLTGSRVYGPNVNSQTITQFLLGRGDGTFVAGQSLPGVGVSLATGAPSFALADFNGDTFPDVVAPVPGSGTTLLLQSGSSSGTFAAGSVVATMSFRPTIVTAGDVDGDGKPDIVAAGSRLAVLRGLGGGVFAGEQSYALPAVGGSVTNLAVADFNGDGRADVVVLMGAQSATNGGAFVYLSNADGTLRAPLQIDNATNLRALAVGDLNGDGRADIAVGGLDPQFFTSPNVLRGIRVYRGNADGSFSAPVSLNPGVAHVALAIGDMNNDGRADLVVASQDTSLNDTVFVLPGNGDGTFGTAKPFAIGGGGPGIASIAIGDFTFDGNVDVLIGGGGYSAVLIGNGDGTFAGVNALTIANGSTYVVAADLNRDGMTDAIVSKGAEGLVPLVRTASAIPAATTPATAFSFVLASASATLTSGESTRTVVDLTFPAGFTAPVSFSCTGLPVNARCTFSPSTVTPGAATATTLAIATGVAPTATARSMNFGGPGTGTAIVGLGSVGLIGSATRRRIGRRRSRAVALRLLFTGLLACGVVAGCNDHGSGSGVDASTGTSGPPIGTVATTPSGSYAISIVATAGSDTQTAIFALTVK